MALWIDPHGLHARFARTPNVCARIITNVQHLVGI
jgi:hypothetical protein